MTPLLMLVIWVIVIAIIAFVVLWLIAEAGAPPNINHALRLLVIALAIIVILWKVATVMGIG